MIETPHIDYLGIAPVIALTAGICVCLLATVFEGVKRLVPGLAVLTLAVAGVFLAVQWDEPKWLISEALRLDNFAIAIGLLAAASAVVAILLSVGEPAADEAGRGEYHVLILGSVLGMVLLSEAASLVSVFIGIELLSIPLYVLCATNLRRSPSLESGLKYLVIGSLGSATLLYGLALIYGAAGAMGFPAIASEVAGSSLSGDPLLLFGIGLVAVGLAFKVSIAPFHQWTPDVYQGAPTPVTAFMAVATKAAAFAIFVRLFLVALGPAVDDWDTLLAILAAITIVVGNVGAIGQDSVKRMLGFSGVAQAGYMLGGVVVATEAGVAALVFYLVAYTLMNLVAFAIVIARERETHFGDDLQALQGIGHRRPLLAWPLTIAMFALAGLPGTAGFVGKLYLIEALAGGDYVWLAVMIAIGSAISLAYYLRVVAAVWMKAVPVGAGPGPGLSPEAATTRR
jgi:NADH-quinone oxidoreductase subunit N